MQRCTKKKCKKGRFMDIDTIYFWIPMWMKSSGSINANMHGNKFKNAWKQNARMNSCIQVQRFLDANARMQRCMDYKM